MRGGGIDNLEFEEVAEDKLSFRIPADWNGQMQIQGNAIRIDENGIESIVSADSINTEPQFWGVTMQRDDQTFQWVKDCESKQEAQDLMGLLALIDVAAEQNEHERPSSLPTSMKTAFEMIQLALKYRYQEPRPNKTMAMLVNI